MRTTRRVLLSFIVLLFISDCLVAAAQTPLQFMRISPCRLVDTRRSGGPIQGGMSQDFPVPQLGGCNIPASAAAYSLNVTVVPNGFLGYLTTWPTGQSQPLVSTLNSVDGRIKANAAIVVAGTDGAISVYVTNTTNVVLDIDGYFVPATVGALAFYPLTPCRILDTRPQNGGNGPIPGGTSQDLSVQGLCNVPTTAQVYSLNFTVVPPGPLGYLTVWPAGESQPMVSTLNDTTGTIVANAALPGAGTGGEISVYPTDTTNLVIDVNGYFAPPEPGGMALFAVTPCRVIDTRKIPPGDPFSGTLLVDVEHRPCAPPASAQAYVMNATVVPDGPLGYLTLWPDSPDKPVASTLNAADGYITNNMAIVQTNDGKINAYASSLTQLVLDLSSYFAPPPPLTITTTSLPDGMISTPYSATLTAIGGEQPYSWSVLRGSSLPPGLGLGTDGTISGTPALAGLYTFTVQVTDTFGDAATATLSINIQTGSLIITTTQLPQGTVNLPYSAHLGASGGTPPYTWSLFYGNLPRGLSLDSGGLIMGTPTDAGSSSFTVEVTDSLLVMVTAPLSITIDGQTNNSSLQGPYALSFSGFKNGDPIFIAGNFIADGNGNITSCVLDINSKNGGPQQQSCTQGAAGTYSIQGNGLGAMTLSTGQGNYVFSVDVSNKGISGTSRNGTLIQRDPASPASYGSGSILVQNSLQFSLTAIAGNYAFGLSGIDLFLKRVAGAGAYKMDGTTGMLSNTAVDINDNGTPTSPTFSGTFSPPDSHTGRGTVTLNGLGTHYVYYIVSSQQIVMLATDPVSSSANLTLWSIARQTSSVFSNLSLNGVGVIETNGSDASGGSPVSESEAGLLTANGQGAGSASIDQNDGGTLSQTTSPVLYGVATNGRVTFSSGFGSTPPIYYLINRNQGFIVGTDSLVSGGILDGQASMSFTNESILGNYLGGTLSPVLSSVTNAVTFAAADGNGDILLSQETSGPGGPGSSQIQENYQVDGTGRATLMLPDGTPEGILYVVSPQKFILLPNSMNPVLSSFFIGTTQ